MKTRYKVILFIAIAGLAVRMYRTATLDGWPGLIFGMIPFGEDSDYAPGYSIAGFKRVTVGMSRTNVYALIGAPLSTWTNNDSSVSERWSRSPHDTDFRCRVLIFSGNIVESKHAEYYQD